MSDFIDQREPGITFERNNPNWTDKFNKENENINFSNENENFKYYDSLKEYPEYKEDVFDVYNHEKINHRMDALKYCIENKIPFLFFNDKIYDWNNNIIDINYFDLPDKIDFLFSNKLSKKLLFASYYQAFDYTKDLGKLVVKIIYTDGSDDTLSTKPTKGNTFYPYDFDNESEFFSFIKFLDKNNIPLKRLT